MSPAADAERQGSTELDAAFTSRPNALRRRFGIAALLVVVILVAFGGLFAWRQYDQAKERALTELRGRVVLASAVFDTYFGGQIATLNAIANAPAVRRGDTKAMAAYFARLRKLNQSQFTGGIGWIDREGISRVSSANPDGPHPSVADRTYFRTVLETGKPYVSEGLTTRVGKRRVVIMAVPTFGQDGRPDGVLAGALKLKQSSNDKRTNDLGFQGLVVLDRAGQQLTLKSFAKPENAALVAKLRKGEGVLKGDPGLDGDSDHVLAYSNAKLAGWTTVIDRPSAAVYAQARHGLILELATIALVALVVLALIGWVVIRSRRDIETERNQMRRLDELGQSLGDASAAAEVSEALASALATAFPRAGVIVALVAEDRPELEISAYRSGDGTLAANPNDPELVALANLPYEASEAVVARDPNAVGALAPSLEGALGPRVQALYGLPLLTRSGRPIGSVTLLLPQERVLDEPEEALVAMQAGRAARALTRALRHEQEHEIALALQRSLLPDALPAAEGLDLAGRYSAGGVGLEVGGDWYDAIRRPDGIVQLSVGDVAGRGIAAATLMGQLRNSFRALACEYTSPAEIARRVLIHVPDPGMATAVFLTHDPCTGELTYASLGHPPTMLHDLDEGTVTYLDEASAPPLGWAAAQSIREARLPLPARSALLAYTDGVVERRGTSIDDGIANLAGLLRETDGLTAGEACDMLLSRVIAQGAVDDDMAMLLVRVTGPPASLELELPADPRAMRTTRRRLDAWLTRRGFDDLQRADVVLAITEACNNAIEHAYQGNGGAIRLSLAHEPDSLRLVVEDRGAWRTPIPDPNRGRGSQIMRATMHEVRVTPGHKGTRVELELRLPAGRFAEGPTPSLV